LEDFIQEAIQVNNLGFACEPLESLDSVVCRLTGRGHVLERTLQLQVGFNALPSSAQFLYHFVLRVQEVNDCEDLDDWAEDMQLDPQLQETQAQYLDLLKDRDELRALLKAGSFEALMGGLEIHQAISRARPSAFRPTD